MVVCVCIVLELLHIWTRCFKHWSHLPLFRGKCGGLTRSESVWRFLAQSHWSLPHAYLDFFIFRQTRGHICWGQKQCDPWACTTDSLTLSGGPRRVWEPFVLEGLQVADGVLQFSPDLTKSSSWPEGNDLLLKTRAFCRNRVTLWCGYLTIKNKQYTKKEL